MPGMPGCCACGLAGEDRVVHHAFVDRASQQRNPSGETSVELALTPAVVRSAKAIVSINDHIDWASAKEAQCDTIHVHFQSADTVRVAARTLQEMAAGDCDVRRAIVSRVEHAFRLICPHVTPSEAAGKVPVPLSNIRFLLRIHPAAESGGIGGSAAEDQPAAQPDTSTPGGRSEVEQLLNNLDAPTDSANFADLCVRAWYLHREIYTEASEIRRREAHIYPPLAPLPQDDIPSWFESAAGLWIGVPIRLVFAKPIILLCGRIANCNTGETALRLAPGEEHSLRLHHRLWIECKPCSYLVPVEDSSHPICHKLQRSLNAFLPKERAMVSACIDQLEKDKHAEVTLTTLVLLTKAPQTEMVDLKQEGDPRISPPVTQGGGTPGEMSGGMKTGARSNDKAAQAASSTDPNAVQQSAVGEPQPLTPLPVEEPALTPQALEVCIEKAEHEVDREVLRQKQAPVSIVVTKSLDILVTPKPATDDSTKRRRALLALALVARKGASEFMVDTPDFVQLTHGRTTNIPHDWGESAGCLRDLDIGVESKGRLEALISGFSVTIDESVDEDMIRKRLHKLEPVPKTESADGP